MWLKYRVKLDTYTIHYIALKSSCPLQGKNTANTYSVSLDITCPTQSKHPYRVLLGTMNGFVFSRPILQGPTVIFSHHFLEALWSEVVAGEWMRFYPICEVKYNGSGRFFWHKQEDHCGPRVQKTPLTWRVSAFRPILSDFFSPRLNVWQKKIKHGASLKACSKFIKRFISFYLTRTEKSPHFALVCLNFA